MFYFAVFEEDKQIRENIKEILADYSLRTGLEVSVLWFTDEKALNKIPSYTGKMQAALISLNNQYNIEIGRRIYYANPDCAICYYGNKNQELEPLLVSRPICYYQPNRGDALAKKIDQMVRDYIRRVPIFQYGTRKIQFSVPLRNIRYFQSDLKHVVIHYSSGETDSIFGKLSDIEQNLKQHDQYHSFVRCHKSYLVNLTYIEKLDKANGFLHLVGGETISVSRVQYPSVLRILQVPRDLITSGIAPD